MKKILLMEDDPNQRAHLASLLEEEGYEVASSHNGSGALAIARNERFDLVITDIIVKADGRSTPDGGITLIGQLRRVGSESATHKDVPIIATTETYRNPGMAGILTTAMSVGATAEIKKPIQRAALLAMIEDLLAR